MANKKRARRLASEPPRPVVPADEVVRTGGAPSSSSTRNGTGRSDAPLAGERYPFYCRACDHIANIRIGTTKNDVGSFSPRCPTRAECLANISELLDCQPYQLLDPKSGLSRLAPWRASMSGRLRDRVVAPPSVEQVEGWHSALFASSEPLAYLTERRGLTLDVLKQARVGWDQSRGDLVFPAFADGTATYLYRRKPVDGAHIVAMGGPRQPYPDVPTRGALALVGGELDALSGRQIGLRAVTVSGCSLPDHAVQHFVGRTVYIMFDVGEEGPAEAVVSKLRAAGGQAVCVRLALLGLPYKGDLNDAVRSGITPSAIAALIRNERRDALGARGLA
jgi:hypothetical protein